MSLLKNAALVLKKLIPLEKRIFQNAQHKYGIINLISKS